LPSVSIYVNGHFRRTVTLRTLQRQADSHLTLSPGLYRVSAHVTFQRGSATPPGDDRRERDRLRGATVAGALHRLASRPRASSSRVGGCAGLLLPGTKAAVELMLVG